MTSSPVPTPTRQPADLLNDQVQLLSSIEARLATNEQAQKQIIQKLASLETIYMKLTLFEQDWEDL
jgi:hypothetical protein